MGSERIFPSEPAGQIGVAVQKFRNRLVGGRRHGREHRVVQRSDGSERTQRRDRLGNPRGTLEHLGEQCHEFRLAEAVDRVERDRLHPRHQVMR